MVRPAVWGAWNVAMHLLFEFARHWRCCLLSWVRSGRRHTFHVLGGGRAPDIFRSSISSLLIQVAQILYGTRVDLLGHAIKIYQETDEDLIASRTVFVDAIEVAEYRYTRHILAMKCQNTICLRAHDTTIGSRHLSM